MSAIAPETAPTKPPSPAASRWSLSRRGPRLGIAGIAIVALLVGVLVWRANSAGSDRPSLAPVADENEPHSDQGDTSDGEGGSGDDSATAGTEAAGDAAAAEAAFGAPPPGVALRPGIYRYRVEASVEGDDRVVERMLHVENAQHVGERVQALRFEGEGAPFGHEVTWGDDAVVVTALLSADGRCALAPEVVRYRLSADVGTSWSTASSCESGSGDSHATSTLREEGRVLERRVARVAGQDLDVVVVERREELRVRATNFAIEFTAELTVVEEFSVAHGLVVRFEEQLRRSSERGFTHATLVGEILHLEPAAR